MREHFSHHAIPCALSTMSTIRSLGPMLQLPTFIVSLLRGSQDGVDLSPFTFEMPPPAGQKRANRNLRELVAHLPIRNQPLLEVRS